MEINKHEFFLVGQRVPGCLEHGSRVGESALTSVAGWLSIIVDR